MVERITVAIVGLALLAGCQSTPSEDDLPANIRADRAYEAGDYGKAAQLYTQFLAENPSDFMSLYRRGVCFDKLGDTSAAIASLSAALDLRPDSRDALMARAHAYYGAGNRQLAMADLETAMSTEGWAEAQPHEQVLAYALMSQIAVMDGEMDVALKALDTGIELAEEYEDHVSTNHYRKLLYNRAMVGFALGFYGPAAEDFDHYMVLSSDEGYSPSESDYYNACFLCYMAEDFETARSYLANLSDAQLEVLAQKTKDPTFFVAGADVPHGNNE